MGRTVRGMTPTIMRPMVWALLLVAAAGCGGTAGDGVINCSVASDGGVAFGGSARYEDRIYNNSGFTGERPLLPVRHATVELRKAADGALIAVTRTDAQGQFCIDRFAVDAGTRVVARLRAEAKVPGSGDVAVMDRSVPTRLSDPGTVYYLDSAPAPAEIGQVTDLSIRARTGSEWRNPNVHPSLAPVVPMGAAFNVLDVASRAMAFVRTEWDRPLPNLRVDWRADVGGGTFFLNAARFGLAVDRINMKGDQAGDSDEYDDDIILHEFGHFVLLHLGAEDSRGGPHFINGVTQDARLSWSEGWASFFSALARDGHEGFYSNRSGIRGSIIDALTLTEGAQSALRFSFELATPEAFVGDQRDPDNPTIAADPTRFRLKVRGTTSESSVGAALWDLYDGGPDGAWPGIGARGIRDLVEHMAGVQGATFADVMASYAALFPATAAVVRNHMVADRSMSVEADMEGDDDTLAELDRLTGTEAFVHRFNNLGGESIDHTLFPAGDVDLFRLNVTQNGVYQIRTTNLSDGADTHLDLLAADGVTVLPNGSNDNYIALVIRRTFDTDDGPISVPSAPILDHTGCERFTLVYRGEPFTAYGCPPNPANPPLLFERRVTEFLASQVIVELVAQPEPYVIRVSRAVPGAPSAGKLGRYDLVVQRCGGVGALCPE